MAGVMPAVQIGSINKPNLYPRSLGEQSSSGTQVTQIIYNSKPGDFLGESQFTIYNVQNMQTGSCSTIAKFESGVTLTSENIVKLIGQRNYDNLLTALCSVLSQEWRIKSILSILTENKPQVDQSIQTSEPQNSFNQNMCEAQNTSNEVEFSDATCDIQPLRYEDDIHECKDFEKTTQQIPVLSHSRSIEDISIDHDDSVSCISNLSNCTSLLNFPVSLLQNIDEFTETECITVGEKTIQLPFKVKDHFHYVSSENLSKVNENDIKFLWAHQLSIDYKHCMDADDENMLPIHHAVNENDAEVVIRHSEILRNKAGTVDVLADGDETPLHLAVTNGSKEIAKILLSRGASMSIANDKERNAFHLAADTGGFELLKIFEAHCENNPSYVIQELRHRWCEKNLNQSPSELKNLLIENLCSHDDSQGYTPLMLACRNAHSETVELLIKMSNKPINYRSKASGETALYQTVVNACLDAEKCGSKISEPFLKTIQLLMNNGARPEIASFSGTTISQILCTDNKYAELVMLIMNNDIYKQIENREVANNFNQLSKFIIVKNDSGESKTKKVKKGSSDDKSRKVKEKINETCIEIDDDMNKQVADTTEVIDLEEIDTTTNNVLETFKNKNIKTSRKSVVTVRKLNYFVNNSYNNEPYISIAPRPTKRVIHLDSNIKQINVAPQSTNFTTIPIIVEDRTPKQKKICVTKLIQPVASKSFPENLTRNSPRTLLKPAMLTKPTPKVDIQNSKPKLNTTLQMKRLIIPIRKDLQELKRKHDEVGEGGSKIKITEKKDKSKK